MNEFLYEEIFISQFLWFNFFETNISNKKKLNLSQ